MRLGPAVLLVVGSVLLAGCVGDRYERWEPLARSSTTRNHLREDDVLASAHLSSSTSALLAGIGAGVVTALLAAAGVLLARGSRRARAEQAESPVALLADGPAVVTGVVELEPGATGPAAEARVYQRGREQYYKGNWSHSWRETSREVRAQRFHIRRDDGLVVRVEPGGAVEIHAPLAPSERTAPDARTCTAPVPAGARVRMTGEIEGSAPVRVDAIYRDAPSTLMLRPPRGGKMVISTERPGEKGEEQARFHARWAIGIAVTAAIVACAVLPTYLVLAADGETVDVQPEGVRRRLEWTKPKNRPGYWVPHYEVRAVARVEGQPVPLFDDCSQSLYDCVKGGTCGRVPFVVATHGPESFHEVGPAPTLTIGRAVLTLITVTLLAVAYAFSASSARPWYRKGRVDESGAGRLG